MNAHAATFVVISADDGDATCDDTHCSLREAIKAANLNAGSDAISFAIPGSGVRTILPATALPIITGPVVINGYTQPGASPNTLADGDNAVLLIELDGIQVGGTDNGLFLTGGGSTVRGLVINHFGGDGIRLGGAGNNTIAGNFLGTIPSGLGDGANDDGIVVDDCSGNTIGGVAPADRNLISGNADDGVDIRGPLATGNVVVGNFIGTTVAGSASLGNADEGLQIRSSSNTIGGTAPGARNVISGNAHDGIHLQGADASGNVVVGNLFGLDPTGTADVANLLDGIFLDGASSNTIGGTSAAARNVISRNLGNGITIQDGSSNVIQGNFIGTDVTGTLDKGNHAHGIAVVQASGTKIGGSSFGARNVISANALNGVLIASGTGTIVEGNLIGTDANGEIRVPNFQNGVEIHAASNTVGGTSSGAGNVISGNFSDGIFIVDPGATGNLIAGNLIGVDAAGTAPLPNGIGLDSGVVIDHASGNTVGGTTPDARNVISGNDGNGVRLVSASTNIIAGNFIGTDISGTVALGNSLSGVTLVEPDTVSTGNVIGGTTAAANVISGNGQDGIEIFAGTGNLVQHNFIGTDATGTGAIGNTLDGVEIAGGSGNTIGGADSGNRISFNGRDGVRATGGTGNAIESNAISANTGLGIDLNGDGVTSNDVGDADLGPNDFQNFPELTSVSSDATSTTIAGSLHSNARRRVTLEFFANAACDSSGSGEGQTLLGSTIVTTPSAGLVTFTVALSGAVPVGQANITATATDADGGTSEFSSCAPVAPGTPPPGVHDMAVVALSAPKHVKLTARAPMATKQIKVVVQNRSQHSETIGSAAVLDDLVNVTVDSLAGCADPTPTLVPPKKFPIVLKSKKTLAVKFTVTFACANDPAKTTRTGAHDDYRDVAVVNHAALDAVADTHPADDVCPHAVPPPFEIDVNPDHTIRDKGCGAKKADKTFGADVLTDVEVK